MKNNNKFIALAATALILLSLPLAGCEQNKIEEVSSAPVTIIETADTPDVADTKDTPDTSIDTEDDEEEVKAQPLSMVVSSSSEGTADKTTSQTSSKAANKSKNTSSKATSSKEVLKITVSVNVIPNNGTSTTTTTVGGQQNDNNTANTTTQAPVEQQTQSQTPVQEPVVSYYEPEPQPTPEPEPEPTPEPEPEPPAVDSPYARPFDVETIRNDMIAYGQERGLVLDESLNIDNAAWSSPDNTRWWTDENDVYYGTKYQACLAEIDCLIDFFAYEGTSPDRVLFNVQIIEIPEYPGEYRIYVPYG